MGAANDDFAPILAVQLGSAQSQNPPAVHPALSGRMNSPVSDQNLLGSGGRYRSQA
jgi:hypothetical protein